MGEGARDRKHLAPARHRGDRDRIAGGSRSPRLIAVVLLLLNAVAYSAVGFGTLGDERIRLGVYLLGAVAAHVAVARFVLMQQGAGAAFARVALGIAVTLLTIVVPVSSMDRWWRWSGQRRPSHLFGSPVAIGVQTASWPRPSSSVWRLAPLWYRVWRLSSWEVGTLPASRACPSLTKPAYPVGAAGHAGRGRGHRPGAMGTGRRLRSSASVCSLRRCRMSFRVCRSWPDGHCLRCSPSPPSATSPSRMGRPPARSQSGVVGGERIEARRRDFRSTCYLPRGCL